MFKGTHLQLTQPGQLPPLIFLAWAADWSQWKMALNWIDTGEKMLLVPDQIEKSRCQRRNYCQCINLTKPWKLVAKVRGWWGGLIFFGRRTTEKHYWYEVCLKTNSYSIIAFVYMYTSHHDLTFAVDWVVKTNYLSILCIWTVCFRLEKGKSVEIFSLFCALSILQDTFWEI